MKTRECDIAVIGGGAAGLTAAAKAASLGKKTLVIERNSAPGGVLLQCIHNGFGLHYFKEELTGPEYAERVQTMAEQAGAEFLLNTAVVKMEPQGNGHCLTVCSKADGVTRIRAKAVILAAGCRERCRGNLGIPGDRIAGVLNAGLAQQLLNQEGLLPGTRAVIVGSGDIGLIMARRLTWCGIKVECVIEIMPYPAGLSRNIAQCLEDFGIPLYLSTGVTGIHGKGRVEAITFAPLVDGKPDLARERRIDCDTVLFSVGLIPENELARECGVPLNPLTGGALVDGELMTAVPGIFSCGNGLHVHDLVDFVSQEAERCAGSAARYCGVTDKRNKEGSRMETFGGRVAMDTDAKSNEAEFRMDHEKDGIRSFELATRSGNGRKSANSGLSRDAGRQFETFGGRVAIPVKPGANVRYTVPNKIDPAKENPFFLRSRCIMDKAELIFSAPDGKVLLKKALRYVKPAEMISAVLPENAAAEAAEVIVILEDQSK